MRRGGQGKDGFIDDRLVLKEVGGFVAQQIENFFGGHAELFYYPAKIRTLCVPVDAIQILEGHFQPFGKTFFGLAQPYPWIVMFFIRLGGTFGVAQLTLEITFVLLVEFQDAIPESPLQVGIDIHLDGSIADGFADLVLGTAAAAMEYEIDG